MSTNFEGIHPTRIRQILLLSVVLLIGWVLWREMYFMLGGFFGAVTLYVLLRRPMLYLVFKKKWKRAPAAILLMLLSLVVIIYPFAWVIQILVEKLTPLLKDTTRLKESLNQIHLFLLTRYNFEILTQENINKMTGLATGLGGKVLSSTLNTLTNLFISYFLLWFMLMRVGTLQRWLRKALPVRQANSEKLLAETRGIILSNAIGIPLLGLIQGVVAMIGYIIFGIEEYILWGIITGIASVIPFAGTMAAWVPLAILTFARGDTANGIGLTLWGLLAIGMSDNIFRFVLQKYLADMHPIITVFGVIVGLNLFGFLGLIFGPLIISLFFLLVRIYYDEYVDDIKTTSNEAETE
ncbi:MAG: AI-2E family transporter [Chitinophagaceae bacterium]|jgi:predicted PurR-regulated permease PerM|nr:AI-2E family transporter [Chitinophagaceae bacterium]